MSHTPAEALLAKRAKSLRDCALAALDAPTVTGFNMDAARMATGLKELAQALHDMGGLSLTPPLRRDYAESISLVREWAEMILTQVAVFDQGQQLAIRDAAQMLIYAAADLLDIAGEWRPSLEDIRRGAIEALRNHHWDVEERDIDVARSDKDIGWTITVRVAGELTPRTLKLHDNMLTGSAVPEALRAQLSDWPRRPS